MKGLFLLVFLLPLLCAAESSKGASRAIGHIAFGVQVPPVFKILQVTPVAGGNEYRAWTNMKFIVINGKEYRLSRVGETTLFVPASKDTFIVHGL